MMASPRFKKMLSGDWVEAKTIHPDGYQHVELEGFNPEGTKIVLNILHEKTRRVPRTVDIELLAEIAVVVDDLECYEEVEVFSDMWIAESRASVPIEYDRDLILMDSGGFGLPQTGSVQVDYSNGYIMESWSDSDSGLANTPERRR